MPLIIHNVIARRCNTGFFIGAGVDASLTNSQAIDCRTGFHLGSPQDPTRIIRRMGLPRRTPPHELLRLLEQLAKLEKAPEAEKRKAIGDSRLMRYLEGTGRVAELVSKLIDLSSKVDFQNYIADLKRALIAFGIG